MTIEKRRIMLDSLNIGMTGATLLAVVGFALWSGGILERVNVRMGQALTVQDGVSWEREFIAQNPAIKPPDIRAIHAANAEQDERTLLRR